ncbi:YbhB/YbcL family Raf kinase inhibitor-like protein [Thermobifida cellulosilytica]|uniref:Phosphatidylethanolamine-binding protein n=1 Tax=Thermobifida cellulosilytica TB100 TaxID=665004 RepID=A0A147KK26_THECS|nr:YbhB/YbcL family Raf kinase inhibitor-like protein [Thermobifida cellulosilytica]KUP97652.1 phosphatidylethanolamine-binding protein [Thermobifida cellulosilytica TB100]
MFALARHRRGAAAAALLVLSTGCGVLTGPNNSEVSDDITVTSPMLREGEKLPDRYTCRGEGMSPPLRWSGLPAATESLALVVDDVHESGSATVHWVVYGLDPADPELPEGTVPMPAQQGINSFDSAVYEPPCPRGDDEHEFRFTVYALSEQLELGEAASLDVALGAIAAHTLARGRLTSVP